ncbi:YchJ family protein [Methylotetracoccus oryzae]|uniref:YchJ family protein n=1 Tax=Methylotetracoccus oryzae TaxID=1919059 RepID=UPI0011180E9D|nr:YchJ family protein [Methylotetracoccus oryzae]
MSGTSGQSCPCGSSESYTACCGRYHLGDRPTTAEALMRSRYSAHVLGLHEYLTDTWHPSTRPADAAADGPPTTWLGLRVKRSDPIDADHAIVEFEARYRVNGRAFRIHEISRFAREGGRWFYIDGHFPEG